MKCKLLTTNKLNKEVYGRDFNVDDLVLNSHQKLNLDLSLKRDLPRYLGSENSNRNATQTASNNNNNYDMPRNRYVVEDYSQVTQPQQLNFSHQNLNFDNQV